VFSACTGLAKITVDGKNPDYTSKGGILYNKEKTKLIVYPTASGAVTIPDNVTSIDIGAFFSCTGLTGITIPGSVTSIGEAAFYNCTELISVTFETESAITDMNFGSNSFPGGSDGSGNDALRNAYLADGAGTYTREANGSNWTKQ